MDVTTVPTPAGPLVIVADDGVVLAAGWTADPDAVLGLIHPSLCNGAPRRRDELGSVTRAVAAYLDGDLDAVDDVPVRQLGGPFLEQGWKVLREVEPGAPISYRELAERIGRPDAVRAAANVCGRNAPALFVPCHRVIRSDGTLGGFRWGLDVKRWLLDHERPAAA